MSLKYVPKLSTVIPDHRKVVYIQRPDWFVEEIIFNHSARKFGGDMYITDDQREILLELAEHRRIGVKAGRGIGKSAVLSWCIIWWLSMFDGGQVAAFAPSFAQLNSVLWPEVSKWLKHSLVSEFFTHTATKVYLNEDPKNTFAEPRTAAKEEGAQGLHGDHLLILLDEAPGIQDMIWNVLQGSLTDDNNKVVAVGNPARTSGFFFDAFHGSKATWRNLTYSSEDSPNVDKQWVEEMKLKYVQGDVIHDIYRVHVQGEFPSGDAASFIALEEVDKAMGRTVSTSPPVELGIDVARFGDDLTCIVLREGNKFHKPVTLAKSSIDLSTSKTLDVIHTYRQETGYSDVIRVKVDDSGVGGGVTDLLRLDRDHNIEVVACNFGGAGNANYSNEASIMWGNFKDGLAGYELPDNQFLKEELASRKWELDSRGRIKIQPKSQFKKEYGSSPDHADAFILAAADKKNDLLHVKSFDYVRDSVEVTREMLRGGDYYASIYQDKNGKISAVFASYWGGQLRVFDEFVGDSSDVIRLISYYGKFQKIIGSARMFSRESDDLYMQYTQNNVYLQESYGYNQYGAARHLEKLASSNYFKIASECSQTAQQVRTWTIETDNTMKSKEFGLCSALLHIVSELYLRNEILTNDDVYSGYLATDTTTDTNSNFLGI